MPIDIEGRQDGVGVIYSCSGTMTIHDFFQAGIGFLAAEQEIKKWRYCIIDLTLVDAMSITSDQIHAVVEQNKRIAAHAIPGVLLAVASPSDLGYGLGRMWEALMDGIPWEIATFRTRSKADQWIKIRMKQKFDVDVEDPT